MYNRVVLMGRLVADPELKQTSSGVSVCKIRIAVDRGYAKEGEERKSDFINVTCWQKTAEFVSRYFAKGRMIHVEGRLQNNDYTDQNGVKHYSMDVVADGVTFCGDKQQNAQTAPTQPAGGVYGAQTANYAPNPAIPYNGAQMPQGTYQKVAQMQNPTMPAQNQALPTQTMPVPNQMPQYQQQTLPGQGYAPTAQQILGAGGLDGFEEVLSDGAVPF